ncbi:MAG: pilin [Betaproteobacteria bacterium]
MRPATALRGLSMIEMLVVVGIVGILGLMAVPAVYEKLVRDQVIASLNMAEPAKPPIATSWATTQTFPVSNAAAALPAPENFVSNYVSSVAITNGAIDITFGNGGSGALRGKILSIRPAVVVGAPVVPITWLCGHAATPPRMTVIGEDRTDVSAQFLPAACRA